MRDVLVVTTSTRFLFSHFTEPAGRQKVVKWRKNQMSISVIENTYYWCVSRRVEHRALPFETLMPARRHKQA